VIHEEVQQKSEQQGDAEHGDPDVRQTDFAKLQDAVGIRSVIARIRRKQLEIDVDQQSVRRRSGSAS
jgi:hypothetical protein